MNGNTYAILGYAIGLTLLLGYAVSLWIATLALQSRERVENEGGPS